MTNKHPVQYCGSVQYHGDILSTMRDIMSTMEVILSTMGDILSILGDVQHHEDIMIHVGGYNECTGR